MNTRYLSGRLAMLGAAFTMAFVGIVSTPLTLQGRQQQPSLGVERGPQGAEIERSRPPTTNQRIPHRTISPLASQSPSQSASPAVGSAAGLQAAPVAASDVAVDLVDLKQTIDGFGASDAWNPTLTAPEADLFFSTQSGIGLSLLRLNIETDGTDSAAISNAQLAAARGARVWAAPWSAPATWKDNGSASSGGHLCAAPGQGLCTASHYGDWADTLVSFVNLMKSSGVDLYALSVQNEPDLATASYHSMVYSDAEMVNFIKTLGPKLATLTPRPKLLAGEHTNWALMWPMASAVAADATANSYTDIYGAHQYTGTAAYVPGQTKHVWQTEMSDFDPFDPGIDHAIRVAGWINDALTVGNANAWHYWWLRGLNADNEGLTGNSSNTTAGTKRLFALGNFSRFVRPGWVRVNTTVTASGITALAFKNATSGEFAVVVTNPGASQSLTFGVAGAPLLGQVTPYETYDDTVVDYTLGTHGNLQPATPLTPTVDGLFTATVRHGVTTFVGTSVVPAPGAFAKTSPASGVTGQSIAPTLSWSESLGAWSYDYCIDTVNDGVCNTSWTNQVSTSVALSGLSKGTTYYWQVRAVNSGGTVYANGSTTSFWSFSTVPAPPTVTTGLAGIEGTGARFNGIVNPQNVSTTAWFEFGPTTAYGSTYPAGTLTGTSPIAVSAPVKGLTCGGTYHFRLLASSVGGSTTGADQAFVACTGTTSRVRGDIDGDRRADIGIYRPSSGGWWILNSSQEYTSYTQHGWGFGTDVPVPADYDGDGKTDIAVFRPSTGGWWILNSSSNFTTYSAYSWGISTDVPVPADYDGDGKTDIAVYRPSTGGWWILRSTSNYTAYEAHPWGLSGDMPVPADYDGDGKTDIGVYRPSTGEWWVLWATSNFSTYGRYGWGMSGDKPVRGDFDGDGKADVAVYRPSTGVWWILLSTTNFSSYAVYGWGLPGDVPVGADYDGDGRTDLAVYRPTTGGWWILKSGTGFTSYSSYGWGIASDLPLTQVP